METLVSVADQYVKQVIARKSSLVTTLVVQAACNKIVPHIQNWAGTYLVSIDYSGSYAKKTAVGNGSDVDLLISLSSTTRESLKEVYDSLYNWFSNAGFSPRKQNVSIGLTVNGIKVDLVPAIRQSQHGNDHSLYKSKTNSWTKTNISKHISFVSRSGRLEEIKALKIWRDCHQINFPSFNLELAVIESLRYKSIGDLTNNIATALEYLAGNFANARFTDPANNSNVVSDDITYLEKQAIKLAAYRSLQAADWNQILW